MVRSIRQLRTPFGTPFLTEPFARPLISNRRESQTHYWTFILTESFSSGSSFVPHKNMMYQLLLLWHFHRKRVLDQFYLKFCSRNWISLSNLLWICELHGGVGGWAYSVPCTSEYSINSNQTFMRCNVFKLFTLYFSSQITSKCGTN